jgi:hypothetical protein
MITRRYLLVAGGIVLISTAGLFAWSLTFRPTAPGYSILSEDEIRTVDAIAETLFPGTYFPLNGIEADVSGKVDKILEELMDPARRTGFRYILRAIEYGTIAGQKQRFSFLDTESRIEVLNTWGDPELPARRLSYDSIRAIFGMAYFSHPDVLNAIGWRMTC